MEFQVRVYDKDDNEGMNLNNIQIFLNRFKDEINSKKPDLLKLIIFSLKYIKLYEILSIKTVQISDSYKRMNVILEEVKQRNPESNIELLDIKPLNESKQIAEIEPIFVKTAIVKTIKDNLEKHEIKYLIKEVSEVKILTKIENPELEQSILFYNQLVEFLNEIIPCVHEDKEQRQNNDKETLTNPFKDEKTAELFEYLVQNWNYNKQQKWADIWNEINFLDNYKAPYQNEYQTYIIKRFQYTGRFQYFKVKADQNRNRIELIDLIKNFSKK